ncbi:hypothetical protein IVA95_29155 [Bradyrhizobium sp. 157]|uniref:hypothetical protein n=1 Tax=Bradyrhizobium sp. 157 TaxID=2782631 RepID=UPI001FFABF32|nr:hypothetical protein [Bradyrhizobium sp. 157]MCK1641505.1 hypothetical protein [Bradyrhizobium sp. 157]
MRRIVTGDLGANRADSSYGSLAVSAINGSGAYMDAHEKTLREAALVPPADTGPMMIMPDQLAEL